MKNINTYILFNNKQTMILYKSMLSIMFKINLKMIFSIPQNQFFSFYFFYVFDNFLKTFYFFKIRKNVFEFKMLKNKILKNMNKKIKFYII